MTEEVRVAERAARKAGEMLRSQSGGLRPEEVAEKTTHDLVTAADREAEEIIRAVLHEAFPGDGFLGEESFTGEAAGPGDGRVWVVDPLDGTTNFAHGVPPFAVSIALYDRGRAVAAVVYDVPHDELFAAAAGAGATRDGRPISVSSTEEPGSALIATGFPYRDYRYMAGYMESFEQIARAARGIRRHGSASVDLAWVACGRFDGFFEAGLAPWDMAAGVLLVQEAGGRVDGMPAGVDAVWDGAILATNGALHGSLERMTRPLAAAWRDRTLVENHA